MEFVQLGEYHAGRGIHEVSANIAIRACLDDCSGHAFRVVFLHLLAPQTSLPIRLRIGKVSLTRPVTGLENRYSVGLKGFFDLDG